MNSGIRWKPRSLPASELLLRAAADRFAHRGYHGTTVEAIARLAGVNKALVSYHFGGKEQLYLALRRRLLGLLSGEDQDRDTRAWIQVITSQARQIPGLPLFLLREELRDGPAQAKGESILEHLALRMAPPPEQAVGRIRAGLVALLFHLAREGSPGADQPLPPYLEQLLMP